MKFSEEKLSDNGISIKKIKDQANQDIKKIKIVNGKIFNFKEKLNQFVNDFQKYKFVENEIGNFTIKITLSLTLLATVIYLNTFFLYFLTNSCGLATETAVKIAAIFFAPFTEETAKMISIKKDATGIYFVIFNVVEFSYYVVHFISSGIGVIPAIISRIPPILMHAVTTSAQSKAKKEGTPMKGLGIGILMHMIWNTLASLR